MINSELEKLLSKRSTDDVVRSLQIHLGYHPTTHIPSIDEFIENDYYLGKVTDNGKGIYKYWREALRDMFPNPLFITYDTVFLRSAIGTGKSSIARIMVLYVMAKMILMENPHQFYGILPNKELVVFFYALQKSTISGVMYNPLVEMIDSSPFFKANMDLTKKGYHFKNKITIKTGSTIARNVGLDIFMYFMDEVQQERIHGSNLDNYNSLKARVKSRFMLDGGVFFNSMAIISGSPGSAESFVEKLTEKNEEDENAIIYNTPQWEVLKDKIKYSGENFKVFVGDDSNEPRIIEDEKELQVYGDMLGEDNSHLIIDVPVEYRKEFEDDILIAIRDIAGSVTRSTHSFMTNVEKLRQAYVLKPRFFNIDVIKLPFFDSTQIKDYLMEPEVRIRNRLLNKDMYRFIHIDIGVVSDLTGISMSHIAGFVENRVYDNTTLTSHVSKDPWYINDFNIGISRNRNEETSISKIRDFIIFLRDKGVNIHTVTVDGYQSTQLRQELITHGINCEVMSITRDSRAFDVFKSAVYSDRVQIVKNESSRQEFLRFKKIITKNNRVKVVHPSTKSTGSHGDIAESIVGSVYSAYVRYRAGLDVLSGINFNKHRMRNLDDFKDVTEEDEFNLISSM